MRNPVTVTGPDGDNPITDAQIDALLKAAPTSGLAAWKIDLIVSYCTRALKAVAEGNPSPTRDVRNSCAVAWNRIRPDTVKP